MLFHEALHLVFTTFSRKVLQQGRLTNYIADCGVFDTFDDRRTICLTIDLRYGARLYTCLSHSPYKEQFDAIVAEVKLLHPTIDPLQVDYVFQSIRFAWGKIRSVRPPKVPVLFTLPKKKGPSRPSQKKHPPLQGGAGGRPTSPKKRKRSPVPTRYIPHPIPKKRQRRTTPAFKSYTLHSTQKQQIHWKLLLRA